MNFQNYETQIEQVPWRAPWGEGEYDGGERPVDRDVEELPPCMPARNDRKRRPRVANTPVFWC
jgi:hypothetical protein